MVRIGSTHRVSAWALCALLVSSCVGSTQTRFSQDNDYGYYKIGRPYKIKGVTYYPAKQDNYDKTGMASWYGTMFHGKKTANGDIYDMNAMTAAHKTLPLPSLVQVTNLENGKKVIVLVNDRGPFAAGRIIDMSRKASEELGFRQKGLARVRVQYLKNKTDEFLSRMEGGKPRKIGQRMRLSGMYGTEAGLHATGYEVIERTSSGGIVPRSSAVAYNAYNAPWNKPNRSNITRRGIHRASLKTASTRNNIPVSPQTVESGLVNYVPPVSPYAYYNGETAVAPPAAKAANYAYNAPAAMPASVTGDYYIQAATYTVNSNAERAKRHLARLAEVREQRYDNGTTTARRIFVGPARSSAEAAGLLQDVVAHGYPTAKIVANSITFTD